eukprot:13709610-Heterocapsa_arctica.AAC.1
MAREAQRAQASQVPRAADAASRVHSGLAVGQRARLGGQRVLRGRQLPLSVLLVRLPAARSRRRSRCGARGEAAGRQG